MPGVPIHRDLALRTLREHGPMSKAELVELLGPLGQAAGRAIATARHTQPGKYFRIVRYERQRESLLAHIRKNLSNAALARQYGVHPRTIEKVLAGESWSHLP